MSLTEQRSKTLDDKIKSSKLKHEIGELAAKISALKTGDIDKYELLTDQELIPRGADASLASKRFEYSPLGKAFEKQIKAIEEQGEKQASATQNVLAAIKSSEIDPQKELPSETPAFIRSQEEKEAWDRTLGVSREIR